MPMADEYSHQFSLPETQPTLALLM